MVTIVRYFGIKPAKVVITRSSFQLLSTSTQSKAEILKFRQSPPSLKQKPTKGPFAKNLFLGIFDIDILIYPESLDLEQLNNITSASLELQASLDNNVSNKGFIEQFNILKNSGLIGLQIPRKYGGLEMSATETAKLSEIIGSNPSLALSLEMHCSLVTKTIVNYGTDKQKEKYVTKLVSGEWLGAYAMSEETSASDPACTKTSAKQVKSSGNWIINGQKIWVTNANSANLFLVFAQTQVENQVPGVNELSAFIVEKGTAGVTTELQQTLGLEECNMCKVNFNDVLIPKENLLGSVGEGYDIAVKNLSAYKFLFPACISSNLKTLSSKITEYIKHRKQSTIDLRNSELIQQKLANVMTTIYALDSIIYLTTGIIDQYDSDSSLEAAIVQVFANERGLSAVDDCIHLFGSQGYDKSFPYEKVWRDLKGISLAIRTTDILKLFISLMGMQHAGNTLNKTIAKLRNPLNYPSFMFKKMLKNHRHSQDNPILNQELYMQLHPSLKLSAEQLEYCVLRLQYAVEIFLGRHGSEAIYRQLELNRLADVVIDIYVMTSVLARASRAHCTGLRNSDQEVILAKAYCQDALHRVKYNITNTIDGCIASNDIPYLKIANSIFKNGGYFFEHPIKRNIT